MKKLIVNADDFGLHPAINAGIIKGCRDGFITSTSLMCSGAAFDDAVLQAKATPALGVGIHLTLVGGGKTLLQARQLRTLVDEDGLLPADYTVWQNKKSRSCQRTASTTRTRLKLWSGNNSRRQPSASACAAGNRRHRIGFVQCIWY